MISTTPVERVGEILEGAGYRRLPSPLAIADLTFNLPATFIGSDRSSDLVLVADSAFEPAQRILRNVEGIGRALDVMRSRRPLTLVLAGPRPDAETIEALAKVCRVLPIGTSLNEDPATALANWLAVLLPLRLPEPEQGIADSLASVRAEAHDVDERVRALIDVAPQGADAVQSALHELLARALDDDEAAE